MGFGELTKTMREALAWMLEKEDEAKKGNHAEGVMVGDAAVWVRSGGPAMHPQTMAALYARQLAHRKVELDGPDWFALTQMGRAVARGVR